MLDAERIRAQMAIANLSQAELARRVGISQQSIGRVVSGEAAGSRHLHKIARELRTTPAYLNGETDDPKSDFCDDTFTSEERGFIDLLRQIAPSERNAVLTLMRSLARPASEAVHSPTHEYRGER